MKKKDLNQEVVDRLVEWAFRWDIDVKLRPIGKARRKVQLWDIIDLAKRAKLS